MDNWKIFEKNLVTHSKLQQIPVFKFAEDVKVLGNKVIRKKTSFDFVASIGGISAFFDAKVESTRDIFNFKSRMLGDEKIHQWESIKELHNMDLIAGYMIWFHQAGLIAWASAGVIQSLLDRGIKGINANEMEQCVGVVWQKDDQPINLKYLLANDLRQWIVKKPYINSLERILSDTQK